MNKVDNCGDRGRQDDEIRLGQEVVGIGISMVNDPFLESKLERGAVRVDRVERGAFSFQRQRQRAAHQSQSDNRNP